MLLFAIAGVFSSEVTKAAGNSTLIRSSKCGFLAPKLSDPNSFAGYNALDTNGTLAASTYSRACYGNAHNELQCNQYVKPHLSWTAKRNATCPFEGDLCFGGPTGSYEMDTGLIDSHDHLGINAKKSDRIQYRKITTCSVLNSTGRYDEVNKTVGGNPKTYFRLHFGRVRANRIENYTFQYNEDDALGSSGYTLQSLFSSHGPTDFVWQPIPALTRSDADHTLMIFTPNAVTYPAPVHDPMFEATIFRNITSDNGDVVNYYESSFFARAIACTDQFQFCNAATKACTPLTTKSEIVDHAIHKLQLNKRQLSTQKTLRAAAQWQLTFSSVHSRGAAALRASDTLSGNDLTQIALPADQWMTEAREWFTVSLARLQQTIVEYATGPAQLHQGMVFQPGIEDVCSRQMIRSAGGYISFSVLGVSIILIVGSALIVGGLVIDTVVGYGMRTRGWKKHKPAQWVQSELLQLLRLVYEGAGQGNWSGGADAVPVTLKGQKLSGLGMATKDQDPKPSAQEGQGLHGAITYQEKTSSNAGTASVSKGREKIEVLETATSLG